MSHDTNREVVDGPQPQGAGERIPWVFDISGFGTSPSLYPVTVFDEDGEDVTAATTTGSATLTDPTHVTTPIIHSLTAGVQYRVVVTLTFGTTVLTGFFIILAEV